MHQIYVVEKMVNDKLCWGNGMTCSVSVKFSRRDVQQVGSAAFWCSQFYPDVEYAVLAHKVVLSSDSRDEADIRAVWTATLLNEKQVAAQAEFRGDVLHRLAQ